MLFISLLFIILFLFIQSHVSRLNRIQFGDVLFFILGKIAYLRRWGNLLAG